MISDLGELSEKEKELEKLLRAFPDTHYCISPIPNEYEEFIGDIVEAGRDHGWTDEFIRICEANTGKEFCEVVKLIYSKERFPPLEIYDDDTGEILGYGYPGNFPDGRG